MKSNKKSTKTKYRRERRTLSVEEVSKIVESAESLRDKTILLLLYKTGVRVGELCSLNVESVDVEKNRIYVPHRGMGNARVVFFDDETKSVLQRYLEERSAEGFDCSALFTNARNRRCSRTLVLSMVRKAAERAGVKGVSPHTFRRTFTVHLWQSGARRRHLQGLLGHLPLYNEHVRAPTEDELLGEYLEHMPRIGNINYRLAGAKHGRRYH